MAGETAIPITESIELVRRGIERLDAASGALTDLVQEYTDATPFLLALASRFSDLKTVLVRLCKALEHPGAGRAARIQADLELYMASCQVVSDRLLSLAYVVMEYGDADSEITLLEKELAKGDEDFNLKDIDKNLQLLTRSLTLCAEACEGDSATPGRRKSRRSGGPRNFIRLVKDYAGGVSPFLVVRQHVEMASVKLSRTMSTIHKTPPLRSLTPQCIAHKRAAVEARRRSMLIDEQLEADAKQRHTVFVLPVFGSEEVQTMVLEQFILRTPNRDDATSGIVSNSAQTIRENILRHVSSIMELLASDDSSLDESVKAMAREVRHVCEEGGGIGFDQRFAQYLRSLWSNPEVRNVYANAFSGNLECYGDLVVQATERAFRPGYTPTTHDYSRFVVGMKGVFHKGSYEADGLTINFINTRRHFRKLIDQDFPSMLYIVDLATYCTSLSQDDEDNVMAELLASFEHALASRFFKNKPILLAFTSRARFAELLGTKPLSRYFPDFQADGDPDAALDYLLQRFIASNNTAEREIYVHIGELTDSGMYEFIVAGLKSTLPKETRCSSGPELEHRRRPSSRLSQYLSPMKRNRCTTL